MTYYNLWIFIAIIFHCYFMQLIKTHSLQIRKLHETKNKKLIFNTEKLVQLKRCLFTMHCIHHVPCICFWHWWEFKDALVAIASTSNPIFVFVGSGVSHLSPDITLLIMFGFKASTVCWPTRCGNNIAIPVFVPPVTGEFFPLHCCHMHAQHETL